MASSLQLQQPHSMKMPKFASWVHLPLIPCGHTPLICVPKSEQALSGWVIHKASCWGGGKGGTGCGVCFRPRTALSALRI